MNTNHFVGSPENVGSSVELRRYSSSALVTLLTLMDDKMAACVLFSGVDCSRLSSDPFPKSVPLLFSPPCSSLGRFEAIASTALKFQLVAVVAREKHGTCGALHRVPRPARHAGQVEYETTVSALSSRGVLVYCDLALQALVCFVQWHFSC